jgi:hypothetical protein
MKSRTNLSLCLVLLMLMAWQALAQTGAQTATRPNVVLIIADDLAWDDSGAYGNKSACVPC